MPKGGPRKGAGRKRPPEPRHNRQIRISDRQEKAVLAWREAEVRRAQEAGARHHYASFSDAIAQMIDVASLFYTDRTLGRFVPVSDLFGPLWMRRKMRWIRIEPNTGRRLRCCNCHTDVTITAMRFRGIVREILKFVQHHQGCRKQPLWPVKSEDGINRDERNEGACSDRDGNGSDTGVADGDPRLGRELRID